MYPWVIDHVGHMNVQSYTARFDEASWHFLAHLGLSPGFLTENERSLVALDQRIQFKHEVLAGSLPLPPWNNLSRGNGQPALDVILAVLCPGLVLGTSRRSTLALRIACESLAAWLWLQHHGLAQGLRTVVRTQLSAPSRLGRPSGSRCGAHGAGPAAHRRSAANGARSDLADISKTTGIDKTANPRTQ